MSLEWCSGDVFKWIDEGKLSLRLEHFFSLADVQEAHQALEDCKSLKCKVEQEASNNDIDLFKLDSKQKVFVAKGCPDCSISLFYFQQVWAHNPSI